MSQPAFAPTQRRGRHAVVVGGGISGLGAALVLAERGVQVTLLERDQPPSGRTPHEAFVRWQRRGVPQVRHSHVFLGRLRKLLRDDYPDVLHALLIAGARELRPIDRPPPPLRGIAAELGDDELIALGCRRTTFEWVLRQRVLARSGVVIISGAEVHGLLAARSAPPVVSGVTYRQGGQSRCVYGHFIVDASGRCSAAPAWLHAIGARPPREEQESSGIVYYTRFYRLRPDADEPANDDHPTAGDYDWIKFAVFPADGRTFSITLAVPVAVQRLKILSRVAAFDRMVGSIPGLAPWVAAGVSEPIGDARRPVQAMGGLINRLRRFVDDDGPVARRFFVLGDAAYCTNPLYGRGCAQGLLHAHFLGEALDAHPDDLAAAARALDQRARIEIEPFYRASILADRDAVRRAECRPASRLTNRLRQRFFEDGVAVAMRCDPVVFRAFLRMLNMLETPEQAFGRPTVVLRTLWAMAQGAEYKRRYGFPPGPDRDRTIARCEAAVAREEVGP